MSFKPPLFLTGIGQDSHRLIEATKDQVLSLAGLNFACGLTFVANSDGDVILHALCNAISTALGGGSLSLIADPLCSKQGIKDSKVYLQHYLQLMQEKGYHLNNLSLSIEALQPKMEKYRLLMQKSLAKLCQLEIEQVGIAFTSGENLTECGQGQGISAFVSVLLEHE